MRTSSALRGAAIVSICVAGLAGCAPDYGEYDDAASVSAPRPRSRSFARVPLPSKALLAPPGEPDCEPKATADNDTKEAQPGGARRLAARQDEAAEAAMRSDAEARAMPQVDPPTTQADPNADLALRIKLGYERECYRQAEKRVRERLQLLQASANATIKAVNRAQRDVR
ncbi:MAG: hypothetical protein F9K29_02320 [Hyphomicrobiaceae bacterium]|nr:MAG: hypothetical protein F9K29_02320 [Hyphomicrobiaceae bacterium]